jgi:hypothetical protein
VTQARVAAPPAPHDATIGDASGAGVGWARPGSSVVMPVPVLAVQLLVGEPPAQVRLDQLVRPG